MTEKQKIEQVLLKHFMTYALTEEQAQGLVDAAAHFLIVRNAIGVGERKPNDYVRTMQEECCFK